MVQFRTAVIILCTLIMGAAVTASAGAQASASQSPGYSTGPYRARGVPTSGVTTEAAPSTASAAASIDQGLNNIFVTDARRRAYTGPWIAKDPTDTSHIAIAHMEGGPPGPTEPGLKACFLAQSHDTGAHWDDRVLIGEGGQFALPADEPSCAQPAVVFAPDGTLYYLYAAVRFVFGNFHESIFITVSRDGGRSFTTPHPIDPNQPPQSSKLAGAGYEQPRPAVDPRTGRLYVAWTRYSQEFADGSAILVAHSDDRGARFSAPTILNAPVHHPGELPNVAVGAEGNVYVDWNDNSPANAAIDERTLPQHLAFSRSLDGGQTFSPPEDLAKMANGCPFFTCYDVNDFTQVPWVNVGAGVVPGLVILTWSAGLHPGGKTIAEQGPARVHVMRSTDAGVTWSQPEIIGIPKGRQDHKQHHPWLSFSPQGRIDLAYFDSSPNARWENLYLTSSLDFGVHFLRPTRVTNQSIDTTIGPPGPVQVSNDNNYFVGRTVDSVSDKAYLTWNDTRRGVAPDPQCFNFDLNPPYSATHNCIPKQDVMFARAPRPEPAPSG